MQQNLEQLSGAGAVGAMTTVFLDRLGGFAFTEIEFAMVAAGLAAIIGFVVSRLPKREDSKVTDAIV